MSARARDVVRALQRSVAPTGIQETCQARIGGIDQWINGRGQDRDNPVILFIHGGPASPLMPRTWAFHRPLEEYFTVVNYDQRGAGKTFLANDPDGVADTLQNQRHVDEAIGLSDHVRTPHGKGKIIVLAAKWRKGVGMGGAPAGADRFPTQ